MRGKKAGCIEDMADLIMKKCATNGRVQCGIVYCLSRNDCEKVAAELQVGRFLSCDSASQPCLHASQLRPLK